MKIAKRNRVHSKAIISLVVPIMIFIPVMGIFVADEYFKHYEDDQGLAGFFIPYSMVFLPTTYLILGALIC